MSEEEERRQFEQMMRGARVTEQINPETGQPMQVLGVDLGLPGRQHQRTRRCANCMLFDTAERAKAHFRHCSQRDRKIMEGQGRSPSSIANYLAKLRSTILGNLGKVGFCLQRAKRTDSGAAHDFTADAYLCDRWVDNVGIDTNAHPIADDPLIEEVYDKMGETPPSVEQENEQAAAAVDTDTEA